MSEVQQTAKQPRYVSDYAGEFLAGDAVAIVVKQYLLPDDVENPVIFPPTYLKARGRAQSPHAADGNESKESTKDQQASVYNIDDLGDGRNVCEIDSPQSDGNRSEPLFKSDELKDLVPQIVISVNGTPVNVLDAGHRAGDAVIRFSSLAAEFHEAFTRARAGDQSVLATLAPTSILYGAWDSRSTQAKLQRIIKAGVRAQDVRPLTKSATFIPAVDYVAVGAVKDELDAGEGDSNPLSSEGMKHALASQTLGGVRLTDPKLLIRTIKINLVTLRQLKAIIEPPEPKENATDEHKRQIKREADEQSRARTDALRRYVLGLALVAATSDPDLNLREGCNLRITGDDHWDLVKHRRGDERISVDRTAILGFARTSGEAFFNAMGLKFESKDHPDARFEKEVAEEFLGLTDAKGKLSGSERDKVRRLGPITKQTLERYRADRKKREKAGDPLDKLRVLIEKVKGASGGKKLSPAAEKLRKHISENPADTDELKAIHERITEILDSNDSVETKVTALKAALPPAESQSADSPTQAAPEAGQ